LAPGGVFVGLAFGRLLAFRRNFSKPGFDETDMFKSTLCEATSKVYMAVHGFMGTAALREAYAELKVDLPPYMMSKPADFRKEETLANLCDLCGDLTCTQALWRPLGDHESRKALLSKCRSGLIAHGMFPTPALSKLVADGIGAVGTTVETPSSAPAQPATLGELPPSAAKNLQRRKVFLQRRPRLPAARAGAVAANAAAGVAKLFRAGAVFHQQRRSRPVLQRSARLRQQL
jgi:hypothetical protein